MKKNIPTIAGALLGLVFIVFGSNYFLKFLPVPPPAEGAPAAFMGAIYSTGFLGFVKVLELLGGVLVAMPKTRNFGLLILGPIIVNILAYHIYITKGGLLEPPVVLVSVLAAYLLWSSRASFYKLLNL